MKIIFLDFDGVMDTAYYDQILSKEGHPRNDSFGTVFDPNCVRNPAKIIDKTGADIVVLLVNQGERSYITLNTIYSLKVMQGD